MKMIDQIVEVIVDESKWLTFSIILAFLCVLVVIISKRKSEFSTRERFQIILNLLFGITISVMAFGHLLAVTTKIIFGTLEGSILILYIIGISLAVPSWWLIYHSWRLQDRADSGRNRTIVLNSWAAFTLLIAGIVNIPLALPGFLNVAYALNKRNMPGLIIVAATIVIYLFLLGGSIIFFLSGKTFEEFGK